MTARADAQPTLTTARLALRPLAPADAADVQRLAGVFEVAGTTVNIPHPYPDGAAAAFLEAQASAWRSGSAATWAITRDGAFIGCIGLPSSIGPSHDCWHRVEADHLCRNPASGRVMQKLGMTHEGRMRGYYRRFDRWEDVELYARLAER